MINDFVEENEGLIAGYTINEDKKELIIKYLDNHIEIIRKYSKKDLKRLEEEMTRQARMIVIDFFNKEKLREKRKKAITACVFVTLFLTISAYNFVHRESITTDKAIVEFILTLYASLATEMYIDRNYFEQEQQMRKYKLYFENMSLIRKYLENEALYKGIKNLEDKGPIGINTIDKYTVGDLLNIRDNITRIRDN